MASTIMHGRREGQQQSKNFSEFPKVGLMAQGIDPRQVAVFQPRDWQRIQNSLTKYNREIEKQEAQKKDREELHSKSKELVKHWENTIEGQRLKKLQARKNREEQEEIERQKIDTEEAKLQAQKRKEAIERAKQLQYYETDRVKGFHGALLLTEVLKERDAQVEMKRVKKDWQKERDEHLLALRKQNYEAAIHTDKEEAVARFEQACDVADFQQLQIKDKHKTNQMEKQADVVEGKLIKQQYETFQSAKQAIATQNRNYKTVLMNTYKNEIALKKDREVQEQVKEELNNQEIRKFVNAKRKMASMRKKKEEELFEAFQNHTEKMRNKLQLQMRQKVDDEDDRIACAVAEQEKKQLEEEQRKEEMENETLASIKDHRLNMMNEAEKIQQESLLKDNALLSQRVKEDKNFHKSVVEEKGRQCEKASKLQRYHKNQITEKTKKVGRGKEEQLDLDKKNTELLVKEEEIFQEYANRVLDDAKKGNRNPFPLLNAKVEGPGGGRGPKFEGNAGLRPSYIVGDATGVQLPHYIKDATIYNQVYGHVGKSGKRIGFTW